MSRMPAVKREDLSPDHQKIWDHIHAKRSGGGGPYSMLMHSPAMADHFAATEDYFRDHSLLADADREIIILTAAREVDARYAWSRHEIRAHKVGIWSGSHRSFARESPRRQIRRQRATAGRVHPHADARTYAAG